VNPGELDIYVHRIYFFFESGIIFYVFVINIIYLFLVTLGFFALRKHHSPFSPTDRDAIRRSPLTPSISLIVPSYNEEVSVKESVGCMLRLDYPSYEVIVVNDGSKDRTLEFLVDEFKLYKSARSVSGPLETKLVRKVYESTEPVRLLVIDKTNGGKADSINAGINAARNDLVMVVDSDSLIERDGLFEMVKPFLEDPERTFAVGGTVRAVNDCEVRNGMVRRISTSKSILANFQSVEYLRAFFGGRVGFSLFNCMLIISGAFGLFRRDKAIEVGGFEDSSIGEDMELVVRMHHFYRDRKEPYRIAYVAAPVCWTEVPQDWKILHRQRKRWQRGTVDSLWRHREMLLNPRYGGVGMFAFPYFVLFEMFGPLVETLGYLLTVVGLLFHIISTYVAVLFFTVSIAFGILLSTSAVLLDELTPCKFPYWKNTLTLFAAAVLENFGFRQVLTVWRAQGLWDGIRGKKTSWGVMVRRGFSQAPPAKPG
jgi:cellulose synthase/poly-beta-1,6-N-acetylglucosamine synthase-like glycosyltransferase